MDIYTTPKPHGIKSEKYWRKMIESLTNITRRKYMNELLDTVMNKQRGFASERQMYLLEQTKQGN